MTRRSRILAGALAAALCGVLAAAASPASATPADPESAQCQTDPATPKRQFRAMWIASVVNIDWPSRRGLDVETQKAEYLRWLDEAQRLNLNAVVVQIRPTADAFWPSPYEPWSEWLTGVRGQDPGYDPVAFLVDEAHKRNLEFHGWFNPYRVSMPTSAGGAGTDPNNLAPNHPGRLHPEWLKAYPVNHPAGRLYYNPGIPEVRRFVQDAMLDAVAKYDLDGFHWDDYFYPYPAAGQTFDDEATYQQYGAGFPDKQTWRRNNIDLLVSETAARVRALKPWVKFGVSPFGIWRNKATDPLGSETNGLQSYDAIGADTRKWVKEGWLDYIVPQVYWYIGFAIADYAKLVPWWSDVVNGTDVHLYIGQPVYKVGDPAQPPPYQNPNMLSDHLTFNRAYPQVKGDVHFSAIQLRADRLGAVTTMRDNHYARPALIPVIDHLGGRAPMFPVVTGARRTSSQTVELSWRNTLGQTASHAVYRFDGVTPPRRCGFADARHLLTTTRGTAFVDTTAAPGRTYTYYVTGLDRLHHESTPSPPRVVR